MLAEMIWNSETLGVLMGCAIPIAAILGGIWYKVAKVTSTNELKRTLAERGMSADEIERVVQVQPERRS